MGDQSFAEPVAQMGGLFTLDQISDHRHIIPLFKGDAGGGEIDVDFIHLILRNFGQISFHHTLHSACKPGQGLTPGSTLPLYRVILCATDITKGMTNMRLLAGRAMRLSVAFAGLLTATGALAHAHLQQQIPAAGAQLAASPQTLTLSFSEGIEPAFSGVSVTGPQQHAVATGKLTRSADNPTQVTVPVAETLRPGEYTVAWHVVSVDGHKTKGQYTFSVK